MRAVAWRGVWARLGRGLLATAPVALSVAPFGVACGAVLAEYAGPVLTQLMSLTVFAGTAQFVAASMLADGSALLPVLVTGLLINLRLMLLGAALAPHVSSAPAPLRPLLAHLITDESFAVSMAEFEERGADPAFYVGSGLAVYGVWQVATLAGMVLGERIPEGLGFEFALPASLICLLFLLVRGRRAVGVAAAGAALAVGLRPLVGGTWAALAAALIAATLGAYLWTDSR